MRISDWSSDVCTSDLLELRWVEHAHDGDGYAACQVLLLRAFEGRLGIPAPHELVELGEYRFGRHPGDVLPSLDLGLQVDRLALHHVRSEERSVGKECVSPCRSRWWPYHKKKK